MNVTRRRELRLFQVRQDTKTLAVPTKCDSVCCSVEQVHEVPKGLSARIVVDPCPRTSVGPLGLLQGQGDVAKWTPAAGIEEV
jgi:hypothetical protein